MSSYLVVDDNRPFAENLAEILQDRGHQVRMAFSGGEALALAAAERFDGVVTDMKMPTMGGDRFVRELRRVDPGVPVVVVTAFSADDQLSVARQEGLLAVLSKPVSPEQLMTLLEVGRRDGIVAVVEDDEGLCENLAEALRDRGLTALTARSVLELEAFGRVAPFAGLVDLRVAGGGDGEAMLRMASRFPQLPLIAMTGHDDARPPLSPRRLFKKPFSTEELLDEVERLFAQRVTA